VFEGANQSFKKNEFNSSKDVYEYITFR
jgi:hypothetical protein